MGLLEARKRRMKMTKIALCWLPLLCLCLFKVEPLLADSAYAQLSSYVTQMPKPGGFSLAKMEVADTIKNIELNDEKNAIIIKKDGLYMLTFTGQLGSTVKGTEGYMDTWYIKNGKPAVNSNNRMYLSPLIPVTLMIATDLEMLKTGDTISIGFSTSGPNIGFLYLPGDKGPPIVSTMLSVFMIDSK
jgi:hypothetical protein